MTCAGILLAAGASRRFGAGNKLLADLHGRPLVTYAATALAESGCDPLIAVTADRDVANLLDGFEIVGPHGTDPAQADSLRAGIRRAREIGVTQALVVLGDMPFVTTDHLRAVLEQGQSDLAAATTDGKRRMPPACFPAQLFGDLVAISGDHGAQAILRALPQSALVPASEAMLRDIDTPAELADAQRNDPAVREVPPR